MQCWGKDRHGKQRYRCSSCQVSGFRSRNDLTHKTRKDMYQDWLVSKLTLTEYGFKHGVTRRTIDRWFKPFRDKEIQAKEIQARNLVLIIDGYYLQYAATVLIAETTHNVLVAWLFTYAENYLTWNEFFSHIPSFPMGVVCDGQRGMLKAIKLRWPGVVIQRCQFHVIHHVNLLLTRHPETEAARTFKQVTNQISEVKTETDLRRWLAHFKEWYRRYDTFLKARTYQPFPTPTGRRKWHYTHGHLHAAFAHVKNALPYLFQYLEYTEIPNTSNRIEGGINAQLQRLIDRHRGTTLFQRRQMIAAYLRQKQREKPTQNVT